MSRREATRDFVIAWAEYSTNLLGAPGEAQAAVANEPALHQEIANLQAVGPIRTTQERQAIALQLALAEFTRSKEKAQE